jgi:aerotaxis receptor
MPKAAFADMWYTLKQGEPWSGIVKNRRRNGDHYWVRRTLPMVRNGKVTGYMSIRTRATRKKLPLSHLYIKPFRKGELKAIHKGLVVSRAGWVNCPLPLRWRTRGDGALWMVLAAGLWLSGMVRRRFC